MASAKLASVKKMKAQEYAPMKFAKAIEKNRLLSKKDIGRRHGQNDHREHQEKKVSSDLADRERDQAQHEKRGNRPEDAFPVGKLHRYSGFPCAAGCQAA